MGELVNLTSTTTGTIPEEIARDTEVTAAINTHASAVDPHPIYLSQTEGDARYRRATTTQFFQGGLQEVGAYASCQSSGASIAAAYTNAQATNFTFGLHVQSQPWSGAAYMAFHRPGSLIAFFGLDNDNQLKWGGGNIISAAHRIWHEGYGIPVWQAPSDRDLKDKIRPIPSGLSFILESKPVSFQYNKIIRDNKDYFGDKFQKEKIHYGFLANEFPLQDLVSPKINGFLGLDYVEIIPFLVRAIQELHAELHAEIEKLRVSDS